MKWVGLGMAIVGAIVAIVAGAGEHWMVAIIGGVIFVIGMFALAKG